MTGQLPQPGQIFLGHVAHIVSTIVRKGMVVTLPPSAAPRSCFGS